MREDMKEEKIWREYFICVYNKGVGRSRRGHPH
nr:MAG TPA: Synapse associated protein 1 associated protein 1, BSD [Ackermannviridae sp.]